MAGAHGPGKPSRAFAGAAGLALAALLAAGCGRGDAPEAAAASFWEAVRAGDADAARAQLADVPDAAALTAWMRDVEAADVEMGEVLRPEAGAARALVETRLRREDDRPPLAFHTHLVRQEEGWRVDFDETARALRRAELAVAVEDVEEALRESGRAVGEALERSAREATKALRDALEELDRVLGGEPERGGRRI